MEFGLRLVAGIGALSYTLNRAVARVLPGPLGGIARRFPIGTFLAVAGLVALIVRSFAVAAPFAEVRAITPANVHLLGREPQLVTISGELAPEYIVTFPDRNNDGLQQEDEDGVSWIYFVVETGDVDAVQIRSRRSPEELPAGGPITFSGVLRPASNPYDRMVVEGFDPDDLWFTVRGFSVEEGASLPAVRASIEAAVLFGGLALLLLLGWRIGYLPFRSIAPVGLAPRLPAPPRGPVRAQVTGTVPGERGPEVVRAVAVAVAIREDPFGRRTLVLTRGINETLAEVPEETTLRAGEACALTEVRHAMQVKGPFGPLTVAFETVDTRDDYLSAVTRA